MILYTIMTSGEAMLSMKSYTPLIIFQNHNYLTPNCGIENQVLKNPYRTEINDFWRDWNGKGEMAQDCCIRPAVNIVTIQYGTGSLGCIIFGCRSEKPALPGYHQFDE